MPHVSICPDFNSQHESGLDGDVKSLNSCRYGGDVENKNSEKINEDFVRGVDDIRTYIGSKLAYIEGASETSCHDDVPDAQEKHTNNKRPSESEISNFRDDTILTGSRRKRTRKSQN